MDKHIMHSTHHRLLYCRDRRQGRTLWTYTCHFIFFVWRPFMFLPGWRLALMEGPGLCKCSINADELFSENGSVLAKLKISNRLTATWRSRLKIAVSRLPSGRLGPSHLRAALRLLSTVTVRSMEVLFIRVHSVQGMQVQVPVSMTVEGVQMRSG